MVSDRYNDIWVVVPPQVLRSAMEREEYARTILGIAVRSEEDIDKLIGMMNDILLLRTRKICLWIDVKICYEHEEKMTTLLQLLYSTGYLFRYGRAVMCLVSCPHEADNGGKGRVEELVGSLGFTALIKEIQGWDLSGICDGNWFIQADNHIATGMEVASFYVDLLTKNFFVDHDIFIISENEEKIEEIVAAICKAEKAVPSTSPRLHDLYQRYRLLSEQNERSSNENRQLEIDLANQKKYLAVLRKENEMERIIEFYHREYEVLPLWYKRVGHIIKIFTGKRKIHSNRNQK